MGWTMMSVWTVISDIDWPECDIVRRVIDVVQTMIPCLH